MIFNKLKKSYKLIEKKIDKYQNLVFFVHETDACDYCIWAFWCGVSGQTDKQRWAGGQGTGAGA